MHIERPAGPLEGIDLGDHDTPAFVALGGTAAWAPTFETLARRWRCIAFDGGTDPVEDLAAVADHLGLHKLVLAAEGAAAPGAIAAALALHHRVDALVLVDAEVASDAPELGQLHLPTLVLHGQDDPTIAVSQAEALAHAVRGSELILVAGGGSEPTVAKPHLVVDLIDGWGRRRLDYDLS
jgi:pimeloyl-ACP methyl ester carboxylesterase